MSRCLVHDKKMFVSKNFMLGEFLVSESHPELIDEYIVPASQILKISFLCQFGLQPIRDHFKKPVIVTSGIRTFTLNDAIGGADDSQHLYGEATDFTIPGIDLMDVYKFITQEMRWPGEVIYYVNKNFIHLALPHPKVTSDYLVIA